MIGVDEVGRGCMAGPLLVVAARAHSRLPEGLTDSKLLSRNQREKIFQVLISVCDFSEGWVSAGEIDRNGLGRGLRLGVRRALLKLNVIPDEKIIIDGKVNYAAKKYHYSSCLVRADRDVPIVSAAGIYAKVIRDRYMATLEELYPGYGFGKHVGYVTRAHLSAVQTMGPIKSLHRFSFKSIRP